MVLSRASKLQKSCCGVGLTKVKSVVGERKSNWNKFTEINDVKIVKQLSTTTTTTTTTTIG
jgi:hypothetical protein